jgi:hypothetical protein
LRLYGLKLRRWQAGLFGTDQVIRVSGGCISPITLSACLLLDGLWCWLFDGDVIILQATEINALRSS